jgi:S-adenosylmethionine/arginine decarboxylase-like enzyme
MQENDFGKQASIDLYECGDKIKDEEEIKRFVRKLCKLIEMNQFGETVVVHFGKDKKAEGFSMLQLIDTSLISGHFANATNAAYIDVFSCRDFDERKAAEFTKKFFRAKRYNLNVLIRK